METIENASTAQRLKEELDARYASLAEAARALGLKSRNQLTPYIYGLSGIGSKMRARLEAAGIDTGYILTGRRSLPVEKSEIVTQDTRDYVEEVLDQVLSEAGKKYSARARAEILKKARELDRAYLRGMLDALIRSSDAGKHEERPHDPGRPQETHSGSGNRSGGEENEG